MKRDNVVPLNRKVTINNDNCSTQERGHTKSLAPSALYDLAFTKEVRAKLLEMKRREYGFAK